MSEDTGFKDIKGNPIHVGDIVKFNTKDWEPREVECVNENAYMLKDTSIVLCQTEIKWFGLEVISSVDKQILAEQENEDVVYFRNCLSRLVWGIPNWSSTRERERRLEMSAELTKQWRDGELEFNRYYYVDVHNNGDTKLMYLDEEGDFVSGFDTYKPETHEFLEVRSAVPTWEEYGEVQTQCGKNETEKQILKEELAFAKETLRRYADETYWTDCRDVFNDTLYSDAMFVSHGYDLAKNTLQALKEHKL